MGTITGQSILDRQRDLVQDIAAVRWLAPECLRWLNDGLRELCIKRPSSYILHAAISLGATAKNSITLAGATGILDIPHNVDSVGNPGRTIREASVSDLDMIEPDWRTSTGDTVRHWVKDAEPHTFYTYPGRPKTSGLARKVEVVYTATPPEMSAMANVIPVDDIYANALGYYLAFRMYSKDADAGAPSLAEAYYKLFLNAING